MIVIQVGLDPRIVVHRGGGVWREELKGGMGVGGSATRKLLLRRTRVQ